MKREAEKPIRKNRAKKHACYVLITCDGPAADGEMQVEMTYEGDVNLAAYLLQGAQMFMDEQDIEDVPVVSQNKIYRLH